MNSILAMLFAMLFGGGVCDPTVGVDPDLCVDSGNEQQAETGDTTDLTARIQRRRQRAGNRISNGF